MRGVSAVWFLAAVLAAPGAWASPGTSWTRGPAKVTLGSDVAQLDMADGYAFAGAADTQRLLEEMGNTVDRSEVGMVTSTAEGQDWLLVFEYKPEGYIKDDEKDKIDKDAILKSYQEGTEEANKTRKEKGIPGLHVIRWFEEPHYDTATHNLEWALLARDDNGGEVVNYNVRRLGREGYMSITLVDEPAKIAASRAEMGQLLSTFEYMKGKTYAEWVPGDKVAEYGLVALVAGGAGAAAAKMGLFASLAKVLAKGGKAIVLLLVGIGAGIKRLFSRLTGRTESA
jgi:uncharacterized membrane-anchored protein